MPLLSLEATLYLFHHIVLPPKLPHESDWKVEYEDALLDTTVEVLQTFAETVRDEQPQVARYAHTSHCLPATSMDSTQKHFKLPLCSASTRYRVWKVPSQDLSPRSEPSTSVHQLTYVFML